MRWSVPLWALLLLTVSLAGCADGDDAGDDGDEDAGDPGADAPDDGGDDNGTVAPPNVAPTVRMSVNVSSEAPFNATFVLNGTDADGDALSWSLDADGDGTEDASGDALPANATFAYGAEGNYTAVLNVTDGSAFAEARINVTVAASGPALQPFVGSGTAQSPCPQCREAGANTGAGYRAGESGVDSVFLDIPPEYVGQPFVGTASAGDIDLSFRDGCSGGGTGGGAVETFDGAGDPEGVVPEGAVCVLMWNYDTPGTTLTITIG